MGKHLNDIHISRFDVYRAVMAGMTRRDQIARATGVPSNVVSRILNSRKWLAGAEAVEVQDLTEKMA